MKQTDLILNHLKFKGPITPLEALDLYGCFRLGARIHDLKKQGYHIQTETEKKNGKAYARYKLLKGGQMEMAI